MAAITAASGTSDISCSVPSLPPPRPKSPPKYPDLYGKRRGMAKVQMLEREIGFLEEELKSVHSLQPSSRCCKEVTDFVVANPDPLIPTNRKNRRSCRFWKWLRGIPCFNFSWICCCCYSGCSLRQDFADCCACNPCDCFSDVSCPSPKCRCCCSCSCPRSDCYRKMCCSGGGCCRTMFCSRGDCCRKMCCSGSDCCIFQCPACLDCCCCRVTFTCPKCPKVHRSNCTKPCCNNCCLFF